MAVTHNEVITLIAAEALEPYRRGKYDGSTAAHVVYADASGGDSWIGGTPPREGGDGGANGDPVDVELRGEHKTIKVETSAAVTKNASIYPENDGKVSDDAGSVVIGTASGTHTASASGEIIAMQPNAGSGSVPDEESIANADSTTGAAIGIVLQKRGFTAISTEVEVKKPARKLHLVKAWGVLRDGTTNVDVLLKVGGTTIAAAKSFTTTDEVLTFDLSDAVTEVAAASTIYASIATTATAPGMDVYVLCIPIA